MTVTLESLCGNGLIDSALGGFVEDCDDGPANGTPASCCATDCYFKPTGTPCDDGNVCTLAETCTAGVCGGGPVHTCPLCHTCDPTGGCMVGPRPTCKLPTKPGKALLALKDTSTNTGDRLSFAWSNGQTTAVGDFGDPLATVDYALCLFDAGGALLLPPLTAPAGGTCGAKPCWKKLGRNGFRYENPLRDPDGTDTVMLRAGAQGKAKAKFDGKGAHLPPLGLPLALPVTAQLQAENGQCWAAGFSAAGVRNSDAGRFKGRSN